MDTKKLRISLGVAALLLAGAAAAQAPERGRFADLYVGGAIGKSHAKEICNNVADCDDTDNSFGAFAGYWFNRYFAAEVGYHNLGSVTAPGGTYVRSNVWEAVGVGTWQFHEPFSLYGKLGVYRGGQEGGGALASPRERMSDVTYGAGLQVDLPRGLGVRVEWQNYARLGGGPTLPAGDIRDIRLAALWRFR
jgi:OOP family OmpA-OmpF porin